MAARFYEQEVTTKLKNKRKLSAFIDGIVARHKPDAKKVSLNYIFCNDDYLLQINRQYLNHDTLTDIITFDLSDSNTLLVGEIYISTDRVNENAEKFKTAAIDEMYRVIFHGVLHLCGFKDKKDTDKKLMRQMEDECIAAYNKELLK